MNVTEATEDVNEKKGKKTNSLLSSESQINDPAVAFHVLFLQSSRTIACFV